MEKLTRRQLVALGGAGLAAATVGTGALVLAQDAEPTPKSGEAGKYGDYLLEKEPPKKEGEAREVTEDNILGPFYRKGAPFRGKVTPPLEPGTVLLISGRLWGHDTRKTLPGVTLDIWQANHKGRYDNDDPRNQPKENEFKYRTRIMTDENGYYEYETIHPGRYKIGPDVWRPAHIHYLVRHKGYKQLITQLYFTGDPHNKTDRFIKKSLIIDLANRKVGDQTYEVGRFDIVLAKK